MEIVGLKEQGSWVFDSFFEIAQEANLEGMEHNHGRFVLDVIALLRAHNDNRRLYAMNSTYSLRLLAEDRYDAKCYVILEYVSAGGRGAYQIYHSDRAGPDVAMTGTASTKKEAVDMLLEAMERAGFPKRI